MNARSQTMFRSAVQTVVSMISKLGLNLALCGLLLYCYDKLTASQCHGNASLVVHG